jgi:hypothetical protein
MTLLDLVIVALVFTLAIAWGAFIVAAFLSGDRDR